ncbi:MAG TPA: hypothetical protein VED22_06995 [Nitrososphaerales archaeon]|nr:hypothetical protein [Nitrososphaerales archaeon]
MILDDLRVVRLTVPVQLLVPALLLPSLSKSTRGLSLYPGKGGLAIGFALIVGSLLLGALLAGPTGPWGGIVSFWVLGTAGIVIMASALRPTAFVKPICVKCRLLPVIKEHESIHLSGVASESAVWESMRSRHSVESLSLMGDPAICSFCPIPKRLQRQ